jgi:mannose-6-phosphate isomerase-like protein (cupin superfamily)
MMQVFDLETMMSYPYEERDKNVFYKAKEFKTRIIELPSGGKMPTCEMSSYVIFFVVSGMAEVSVNGKIEKLEKGQCLITEPATLSMKTRDGVKVIGIQIGKR